MTASPLEARFWEDARNPLWRLENLYWIVNDEGTEVQFKLRDIQREYLQSLWSRNLTPKSRQHGQSTLICILQLDECLFRPNWSAATICDTKDNAAKMFRNKVKFAWDRLPEFLKNKIGVVNQTSEEFVWGNGSSYQVTTSARSGTLQSLHISEFGKICAKYPQKADEIISGSIPAVVQSGRIHIEATAEGADGAFYRMVQQAKQNQDQGKPLTVLDFKLHFFPWWRKPLNVLDPNGVIVPKSLLDYFKELKVKHGIDLSPSQMAWYVKTKEQLGDLMQREQPSYLDEAFEASVEGAIFQNEMAILRKSGAIGLYPYDPRFEVNTFWDFGMSKVSGSTAVWFHQRINGANRLIEFENATDQGMGYWINLIREKPYVYGKHYVPHDVRTRIQGMQVVTREQLFQDKGIYNLHVVPRIQDKRTGIEMLRTFLMSCHFDEKGCADGIRALDNYRREWDSKAERWSDRPLHNWASDPVDSLMQAAQGYEPAVEHYTDRQMFMAPVVEDEILEAEVGY